MTTLPTAIINVTLHKDRTKLGTLTYDALTCPCLAISDNQAAIAAGNPTHDQLKVDGDLPTGTFRCQVIGPGDPSHAYGPNRRLLLIGISDNALLAMKVRSGLLVHGGDLNPAYTWWDGLRPTHGCLRLKNEDVAALIAALGSAEIQMIVTEAG